MIPNIRAVRASFVKRRLRGASSQVVFVTVFQALVVFAQKLFLAEHLAYYDSAAINSSQLCGLLQPGCSLLQLDGEVLLFGQKGWPKRSCPTGIFSIRFKKEQMKLRPITFSNDSCYLPPLRCPAVCRLDPYDGLPESYLIHGGRTPNNEISSSLYVLTVDSRGCNRKLTLKCTEKELVEDSEELYFGREPHELDDSSDEDTDKYNEDDEEDESQTGYWVKCCLGCQIDSNTWEPYYSTELHRPAMIFCSRGEEGHWVHAQCMELSESLLLKLSLGNKKYFCQDHGGLPYQEVTPPRPQRELSVKRTPMKVKLRRMPLTINLNPTKRASAKDSSMISLTKLEVFQCKNLFCEFDSVYCDTSLF
ncbi:hypothetical protein WMY93_023359 [Mugilogobius chulae]|uniref:Recombination activating protein 2 PHD domain-containing protein n=1 Tax=Mugilogobius chulae TaxID=88201 RepID=A0AAW0N5I6_9GOBI